MKIGFCQNTRNLVPFKTATFQFSTNDFPTLSRTVEMNFNFHFLGICNFVKVNGFPLRANFSINSDADPN